MKFHKDLKVYGDLSYRNKNDFSENTHVQGFVNQVRKKMPHALITHIKNEGKRTKAQIDFDKSMGMTQGFCDIIILGNPVFCLEMKKADHTLSKWGDGQEEFLLNAQAAGCFSVLALGAEAALIAFDDWLTLQ